MRKNIIKSIVSALLILTLTSANFILLGVNTITYAAEAFTLSSETSHKNVSFMAYFKDGENKVESKDVATNEENATLYLQIGVSQEGYFNGKITLQDSNFKFKTDTKHERINSITENEIVLNQITAGETIEIPVGISLVRGEKLDISMLDKESTISLEGKYTYGSNQSTKTVKGTRTVEIAMVSTYSQENPGIFVNQEVLTNKVFSYKGAERRIIQVEVETGMEGNQLPMETEVVEMQAPQIGGKYPTEVLVQTPENLAINGEKIEEKDYVYESESGKVTITVNNEEKDGEIVWNKAGTDKYIVTYIFEGTELPEAQTITANVSMKSYGAIVISSSYQKETTLSSEEVDSSISVSLNNTEKEIYKGAIYEGIERGITQNIDVQVNLINNMNGIKVTEDMSGTHLPNIQTRAVSVDAENLKDILGEEGSITIYNRATNGAIARLTKDETRADLGTTIGEIIIETTKPEKTGKLTISTDKVITAQNRETIKQISSLEFKVYGSYKIGEAEIPASEGTSTISLKETTSYATLEVSKTEFSTMRTNENVEMKIVLHNDDEKYELYKNAHIKLTIPAEFEGIEETAHNLLNEEEMRIENYEQKGNTIEFDLVGEQTRYKEKSVVGAVVLITANLTTNKKQKNVNTQFVLEYENEKAINYPEGAGKGTAGVGVKIESYAGVITTNTIPEYGLDTINNEGNSTGKLALGAEQKSATVQAQAINNYETPIQSVTILGNFPTEKAAGENNIPVGVSELSVNGIDSSRVQVRYSNKAISPDTTGLSISEGDWESNISDPTKVKSYAIFIDELQPAEELDFTYNMSIESGLEYNKVTTEDYAVHYVEGDSLQKVQAQALKLETGKGPEVTTTLSATVGSKTADVAKYGEKIEYTATVKNTGSEDVTNAQVIGKIPEGTVYLEEIDLPSGQNEKISSERFKIDTDKNEVIFDNISLATNAETTLKYMVKVEKNAPTILKNAVETKYGEVTKTSNTVETKTEKGDVEVSIAKGVVTYDRMNPNDTCRYIVFVENISDKDLKNVKLNVKTENAKLIDFSYIEGEEIKVIADTDEITIPKITKGETQTIELTVKINQFDDPTQKQVKVQPIATVDKVEYQGNLQTVSVNPLIVEITNSSENNQYVKAGEEITYKIDVTNIGETSISELTIKDKISQQEAIKNIKLDGADLTQGQYLETKSLEDGGKFIEFSGIIDAGETKTCLVTTQVNPGIESDEAIEIDNCAEAYTVGNPLGSATVTHIIEPNELKLIDDEQDEPEEDDPTDPTTPTNPSTPSTQPNSSKPSTSTGTTGNNATQGETKLISGYAWLDKNENGSRDADESLLSGITVKLFNTQTNEFQKNANGQEITTTTNDKGMYTLTGVPQGNYMVVFVYDNAKYTLTTYARQGVSSEKNSKVVDKKMTIDGTEKTVATTEAITVKDNHISYMNIGLKERKVYDMKIEKMITRVVVQNGNGTETTNFQDSTLAKVDIHAKQLSSSNVVVEYKIRVTNEGEIEGYVKKIADYVSADYKFSSELNKDWYQSGSVIYNNSLASTKLAPGESKEVTLTLTKQMTENNTGLIANVAEIAESYNEQGLKDADSTEGNRAKGEDDMAQADLMISVKTGEIIMTATVIIAIIAILATGSIVAVKIGFKRI